MYKGIYIALSGAVMKKRNIDILAQNIANANTSGYKKERVSFRDHLIPADNTQINGGDGRVMAKLNAVDIDFTAGSLKPTGNTLDLAIDGDGFFSLEDGKVTRSGSFTIDGEGYLTTKSGEKVLGDGGPIALLGGSIEVTSEGEFIVDDIPVGKLRIVDFTDRSVLRKLDGSMFAADEEGEIVDARVSQGYLEDSNVNALRDMIQMIESHREYESYQKIIIAFDEASSKTINEMGR
ncbi:MAG: flagellar hook basal-body protein [Nitrospiraceae bacterium]|nr:MAG: flagellar hook basal-body protein [Nitrospiraceae bacterium]